jgi:hypothetical protein
VKKRPRQNKAGRKLETLRNPRQVRSARLTPGAGVLPKFDDSPTGIRPNRSQMAEMLFQQRIESHRLELHRGNLFDFFEVLNSAIHHAAHGEDVSCRLPQWFLIYLSDLLERTFLAPLPAGWLHRVRGKLRQHLLDTVRFQAVVNLRFQGRSVNDAYDLAAQSLNGQGYKGAEEAVRKSYQRVLRNLPNVDARARLNEPSRAKDRPEKVEKEATPDSLSISRTTSKIIGVLKRRTQLDKLGSGKPVAEIDVPAEIRLSVAQALLLADKILPGTDYLKHWPSPEDGLLATLVNEGDPASAAMTYARENRELRGLVAFGVQRGKKCAVDTRMRPVEPGRFFFVDRGLAFEYRSKDSNQKRVIVP